MSLAEAMARLPADIDLAAAQEMLVAGERGILRAAAAAAEAAETERLTKH